MVNKERKKNNKQKRSVHKGNVNFFDYIPDDLLLCILMLLPSELLRDQLKYVCKRWFDLITNNIFFGQVSLIIQRPTIENHKAYTSRLVSISEGRKKLRSSTKDLNIPCRGHIRSWCNELLLIIDPNKPGVLYVYNLITKEGLYLPICKSLSCKGHVRCRCGLSLAFDKFSREYKVVHVYIGPNRVECEILVFKCELSTFYFTEWKNVEGPIFRGERQYYWDDPVCVEGRFLHWDVHSSKYVVSMDVVEGGFRKTDLPKKTSFDMSNGYHLTEISGLLSFVVPFSGTDLEIWVLRDYIDSKWEKLFKLEYSSYIPSGIRSYFSVFPVASLKNGSNMIFRKSGSDPGLYGYKLFENESMTKLDIQIQVNERCVVQSKDGLWMVCLGD